MSGKSRVVALLAALVVSLSVWAVAFAGDAAPGVSGAAPPPTPSASASAPPSAEPSSSATEPAPAIAEPTPRAEPVVEPPQEDNRLRVYVLYFSPGDHPFYKFGHNAIWIHDETKPLYQRDKVYNWGTFSFGDPALIPKFVQGRFMYWLSIQGIGATQFVYKHENRSITAQELDLSYAEKREIQRLVDENALPENKYYKYDYYRDNCSTRVRDIIDKATDGSIKKVTGGPARLSYRDHTLRLTESLPAEYVVLDLVMGDFIDQPMTEWDEGFIPMEFQKAARKATLVAADGTTRPLVKREWVLLPSNQTPPPDNPPSWWPYSLVVGLILGAIFALSGRAGVKSKLARVGYGVLVSMFGLVTGFFGLFFILVWTWTDHVVGYPNENLMLCVPWGLWLVGTGLRVAFGRAKSVLVAEKLIALALAATLLNLVLKITPWFDQKNGFFLVFFVPVWAGALFGAHALAKQAKAALAVVGAPAKSPKKAADDIGHDDTVRVEKTRPSMKPEKNEKKPAKKASPKSAPKTETKSEKAKDDDATKLDKPAGGDDATIPAADLDATKKSSEADKPKPEE